MGVKSDHSEPFSQGSGLDFILKFLQECYTIEKISLAFNHEGNSIHLPGFLETVWAKICHGFRSTWVLFTQFSVLMGADPAPSHKGHKEQ